MNTKIIQVDDSVKKHYGRNGVIKNASPFAIGVGVAFLGISAFSPENAATVVRPLMVGLSVTGAYGFYSGIKNKIDNIESEKKGVNEAIRYTIPAAIGSVVALGGLSIINPEVASILTRPLVFGLGLQSAISYFIGSGKS